VAVLRSYIHYLLQLRSPYSQHYIAEILVAHSEIAAALVILFEARFDPAVDAAIRDSRQQDLAAQLTIMIDNVPSLDADRVLRNLLALVCATSRTNYYVRDRGDESSAVDFRP